MYIFQFKRAQFKEGQDYKPSLLSLSSAMLSFTPFPFGSEMNGLLPCNIY